MKEHFYIPYWRSNNKPICLVVQPNNEWLKQKMSIRFAVLSDGTIMFGDAYEVLHEDIRHKVEDKGIKTKNTFIIGTLVKEDKKWYCRFLEHPYATLNSYDSFEYAKTFLDRLTTWEEFLWECGSITFENKMEK